MFQKAKKKMGQCVSGERLDALFMDEQAMAAKKNKRPIALPSEKTLKLRQTAIVANKHQKNKATMNQELSWTSSNVASKQSRGSRSE